jgi:hypothetical protein
VVNISRGEIKTIFLYPIIIVVKEMFMDDDGDYGNGNGTNAYIIGSGFVLM